MTFSKDSRLLLIDDEPDMLKKLRRILWTKGNQIDVAANGKEAHEMELLFC